MKQAPRMGNGLMVTTPTPAVQPLQIQRMKAPVANCDLSFQVRVSMLEIYNETIRDLLLHRDDPTTDLAASKHSQQSLHGRSASLDVRTQADGTIDMHGLNQIEVKDVNAAMEVFDAGAAHRATASTNLNEHSSRSHCI